MQRITTAARADYIQKLESISFEFHSLNNVYWDETAHYQFDMREILKIETATNKLFQLCLDAVQHVIDNRLYEKLHIDPAIIPLIERSWETEEPSFYGRFDFAYNGHGDPKMLEFNADTPTSLYEGAVVQWHWLKDIAPDNDQFNSMHEKLIDYWKSCVEYFNGETVYFTCMRDTIEDFTTVEYIRDTAHQAGLQTAFIYIDEIGWDSADQVFLDMDNVEIKNIFKLYPWEWIMNEAFGKNILIDTNKSKWIEPAWKTILSNKGILPILWQLNPGHPNLLECYFDSPTGLTDYVKKPIYSREGANITVFRDGVQIDASSGEYGEEGYIYQQYTELPNFDGNYPVLGSWVIGGESAGMGIRESKTLITDNLSRFIPHLITQY